VSNNNPFGENPFKFPRRTPGNRPGKPGPLFFTIIALAIVVIALVSLSGFYADLLWFRSVDYVGVWKKVLFTKAELFGAFGIITAAFVCANIYFAYRNRPVYAPTSVEADNLERYRGQIDPVKRWIFLAVALLLFYFSGSSGVKLWDSWLLFKNSTPFGVTDPQFHKDISFYAFKLPFYQSLIGWGFTTLLIAIVASSVVHYLYGGFRIEPGVERTTALARVQLSVLLGLLVLLKAVAYWFDRYALAIKDSRLITGLTYTDINALLPAKSILAAIALICAILFFANIVRRSWLLPSAGVVLMAVSSILIAGIYPAAIQQFTVKPSESSKEAPFIQRNIDATRAAYGLDNIKVTEYAAGNTADATQLKKDAPTLSNIRLIDPNVVSATFRQLQQIKPYYSFPDALDIDRYKINGVSRDAIVSVRELNISGNPVRNWINDHLVYTHGFGFVAATGNTVDADGKPSFSVGDIPPTAGLGKFEPRVYFGENMPDYSIIGGVKGGTQTELDYPDDNSSTGQQNYTYQGKGGVPMGSLATRLLFAVKYKEQRILLSNLINKDSKILFNRDPAQRVQKVAPWLTLDGNVYPAIVDGRILWIVDGYTTSSGYPYSKRINLNDATTNTLTSNSSSVFPLPDKTVNYIRNSVKATVDAYDGTVTLYKWDANDPVVNTWSKAFPGSLHPKSDMSAALLAHIRYPEDLFGVQRDVLSTYHVETANAFYGGQDFWRVPTDPSTMGANNTVQPPYYMTMQMPGTNAPAFSLTTAFVPRGNRQNLTAFASVISDNGPDYGKISVLQLPRSENISGPSQVASNFEARPEVAQALSLLRQGGSDVVLGNLLTLPVGGGLLYVQPVYVRATENSSSYPLLQKVLVSFGDQIGFDSTLKGALDQVLSGASSSVVNNLSTNGSSPSGNTSLSSALQNANQALADSQAALKVGDFAAYGRAQDRLKAAIAAAIAAQK
jgi:uncharacterized membrane protein (UPF0182 family)